MKKLNIIKPINFLSCIKVVKDILTFGGIKIVKDKFYRYESHTFLEDVNINNLLVSNKIFSGEEKL